MWPSCRQAVHPTHILSSAIRPDVLSYTSTRIGPLPHPSSCESLEVKLGLCSLDEIVSHASTMAQQWDEAPKQASGDETVVIGPVEIVLGHDSEAEDDAFPPERVAEHRLGETTKARGGSPRLGRSGSRGGASRTSTCNFGRVKMRWKWPCRGARFWTMAL
jgi:hypothetical protein